MNGHAQGKDNYFALEQKVIFLIFYGFVIWNEMEQIKKRSLFNSAGCLRQFNGFKFSLSTISSYASLLAGNDMSWETKTISFS